ncbi:acyl carrier protein [Colwellia sp. 75C3]|uniref:acyl carrier protein n=1 Tax=Colwellia sp. 75C3 TaxID=888425 RepID=UPI000C34C4B0|nr:acyl carrier protein [Colwellia sp. 75C3]PKG82520.1 acyl carrier protein [Colwellia sp. 75C3]
MDINSLEQVNKAELMLALKKLIIEECDKEDDFEPSDILDDELLFGRKSRIALDSLDALQLSLVLKKKFAISIEGSKETRKHLQSIASIAELILAGQSQTSES